MFLKKLAFFLGLGNHPFDSNQWQTMPNKRLCFLKDILESGLAVGMSEKEVIANFGIDFKIYTNRIWSYRIDTWRYSGRKSVLNFYFNIEGKVAKVKLKYKIKHR